MDIFEAFPNAVISGIWELGRVVRKTEIGKKFELIGTYDVILDEGATGTQNQAPGADYLTNESILYAKPDVVDGINAETIISECLWHNSETNQYFEVLRVRIGKNQETGIVEHIEFALKQIEVVEDEW